ncbi:MAG: hypothetical protein H0V70_05725 [Ktedonobacteraceae bacterium]|nr:hypothetical protein [Ktedonobacteraceae bacterium]
MDYTEFEKTLQNIRSTARDLADRVQQDPAFKEQVLDDPSKTLTAAGLPEIAVSDFMRETELGEVAGYGFVCSLTCSVTAKAL